MLEKIEIFQIAQAMSRHAGARQATIARNVANADTPGYRALDISSFRETYRTETDLRPHATRPGHMITPDRAPGFHQIADNNPAEISPNGNSVSIEHEMMKSADVQRQQDLALTIYQTSLSILKTSIGR